MTTCTMPGDARTYIHIKHCGRCRELWPLIADVLDEMTDDEARHATPELILERGM